MKIRTTVPNLLEVLRPLSYKFQLSLVNLNDYYKHPL